MMPIFLIAMNMGVLAQKKGPKTREAQRVTISDSVVFEYTKPRFFDMIKYIPKDIVGFGKFVVQKENLVCTGTAIGG
jgi:hypothetical protein